ncbi:hypothetical protein GGX14DRAFT_566851 [Mycena pura]|uniref:NmrA-like domain-containing protein n=1 Tax=Mycena pura TaxID=153505 RepID=A0AAD6VC20_9AGAR|nr:hypothetical protein GGX14DRAFT_566851 [Mycena pura]
MPNYITNVAIIGATGRIGGAFAEALVKTGKHTVTVLVRPDSTGKLPEGVKTVSVNYDDDIDSPSNSLVTALRGQHFLAITLGVSATEERHDYILKAAGKAGVQYVMPNMYGSDTANRQLAEESGYSGHQRIENVRKLANAACVTMVCGFWYEWSLALGENFFGIDIKNRKVTFFDEGTTKVTVSTWDECGRALAGLLSLPETGPSPCVADWKDKKLFVQSFLVSQRDMLDSLHRVLGDTDADWTIVKVPAAQRIQEAQEQLKNGDFRGFVKKMYSRTFLNPGEADYSKQLADEIIGLPKEDLDTVTKTVMDIVNNDWKELNLPPPMMAVIGA